MTTTVSKKETIADDNVASINLDAITHSPFATRGFVRDRNHPYIAHVSAQKQLDSCPVVRPTPLGGERRGRGRAWEIIEGHKRIWVARRAGLDRHPIVVTDCGDWEAARRFTVDHLPQPRQVKRFDETADNKCPNRDSPQAQKADAEGTFIAAGRYGDEDCRASIARLVDRWGERARNLPNVAFNADRLGIEIGNPDGSLALAQVRAADNKQTAQDRCCRHRLTEHDRAEYHRR
jgi:hypothetical protein